IIRLISQCIIDGISNDLLLHIRDLTLLLEFHHDQKDPEQIHRLHSFCDALHRLGHGLLTLGRLHFERYALSLLK
ncbi:hypothetical protein PENTCL1PPCAC_5065, partial [Pristionchus entomophagus]